MAPLLATFYESRSLPARIYKVIFKTGLAKVGVRLYKYLPEMYLTVGANGFLAWKTRELD